MQLSDSLLDVSGSTATIQEFQQRANRARQLATELAQSADAVNATALADDVGFLRAVTDALAGEDSELDIRR